MTYDDELWHISDNVISWIGSKDVKEAVIRKFHM